MEGEQRVDTLQVEAPGVAEVLERAIGELEVPEGGFEKLVLKRQSPNQYVGKLYRSTGKEYEAIHVRFE